MNPKRAIPIRLLLLEDNPLDAELTIEVLRAGAYECDWQRVETRQAFQAALDGGGYDIILADLNLPGFSGLEGLKLYRQADLDAPFVFVSGTLGEELAVETMRAGATDYVLKGNLNRLVPVVERALRERHEQRLRRTAETAVRERDARYRLMTQAVFDAVWDWDIAANRIEWTEGLRTLFGYPLEHLVTDGDWWFQRIHPDDRELVAATVDSVIHGDAAIFSSEHRFRRADGSYAFVVDRAFVVRDSDNRALRMIGAMTDDSQRRQSEEEIRQLTDELERRVVERTAQLEAANQELEAFTYAVSHDLRAPLRAVESFSAAVLEDCGRQLDERGHHHIARVRDAGRRMGRLIEDLLLLSRVTRREMRWEAVDLSRLARTACDELRAGQIERHVDIEIQPKLAAHGDAGLLGVVLANLLGNAWKYTSKHEHATIAFGSTEVDGGTVFFVRDDGAGFDQRYADRLFVAFQRLHSRSEFEGTGVGLATVRRIVARHGGRVWAEGAPEQGATFYFTLGSAPPTASLEPKSPS